MYQLSLLSTLRGSEPIPGAWAPPFVFYGSEPLRLHSRGLSPPPHLHSTAESPVYNSQFCTPVDTPPVWGPLSTLHGCEPPRVHSTAESPCLYSTALAPLSILHNPRCGLPCVLALHFLSSGPLETVSAQTMHPRAELDIKSPSWPAGPASKPGQIPPGSCGLGLVQNLHHQACVGPRPPAARASSRSPARTKKARAAPELGPTAAGRPARAVRGRAPGKKDARGGAPAPLTYRAAACSRRAPAESTNGHRRRRAGGGAPGGAGSDPR